MTKGDAAITKILLWSPFRKEPVLSEVEGGMTGGLLRPPLACSQDGNNVARPPKADSLALQGVIFSSLWKREAGEGFGDQGVFPVGARFIAPHKPEKNSIINGWER